MLNIAKQRLTSINTPLNTIEYLEGAFFKSDKGREEQSQAVIPYNYQPFRDEKNNGSQPAY